MHDTSEVVLGLTIAAIGIVVLLFIGMGMGRSDAREEMEREAVSRGHAEYVPDEDGRAKWQWLASPLPAE